MLIFRIATWNTQGNSFAEGKLASLVKKNAPDVICLQECGTLSNLTCQHFCQSDDDSESDESCEELTISFGTHSRKVDYKVFFYPWGYSNKRCSLATLVKSSVLVKGQSIVQLTYKSGIRNLLRVIICDQHYKSIIIDNAHLPAHCSNQAKTLVKERLSWPMKDCNFIFIGDMNVPIYEWERENLKFGPYGPTTETQKMGNTLDYIFTDLKVVSINADECYHGSDHLAVSYEIDLN